MTKKKVLILTNNSGGLYRFRKELIMEMIKKGCEVFASTPFDDNVDDLLGLGASLLNTPIDRRGMNPFKDFRLLFSYHKIIKQVKPDLVITYTIKPNLYGGIVCGLLKIPFAINITGLGTAFQGDGLLKKLVIKWYRLVCRKVKIVFFENEGNCNVFIDNNIIENDKTFVLNGAGVNLDDFPFEEYPLIEDKLHFLFIGRIMKEKGVDEMFYAIERLCDEKFNVVLDVLGNYEDNYVNQVAELLHKGMIQYHGYQSDVRPFIKKSHCFVLPSYHEGMANTNLECAAMGRPLITSNIHGCKEAMIEDISGFLCEKENKESLYECMKKFINLSYEEKKKMGLESRKHMENVFDKRKVVKKTIERLSL